MKQQRLNAVSNHRQSQNHSARSLATTALNLLGGIVGTMRSARTSFIAWLALLVMMLSIPAYANTVYSQPPLAAGITQSSYADAAAMDMGYVFCDNFTTTATQTGSISNITWQGQDNPNTGFTIVILNAQPSAPDTTTSPSVVAKITVPDNSSRIKTANANGLYDYYMNLPTPFVLQPNTS